MKLKTIFITVSILIISITSIFAQTKSKVSINEFRTLVGSWTGTLTYLDYSSNKPYTMPADVEISQIGKSRSFIFSNLYPNEPKANSSDTISISNNGKMLNKETVKAKTKLTNGDLEIITEFSSIDGNDNKPATIRITYIFGKKIFKNVKEVQFEGQDKWIKRHEYSYTRK
jgi:hypothetical protein